MNAETKKCTAYYSKNKFTPEEDKIILELAKPDVDNDWDEISNHLENKTSRQCKDRWNNYLSPNLSLDEWSIDEDEYLLEKYAEYGPKWKVLLSFFQNRSINNIRNRCMKLLRRHKYTIKEAKNEMKKEKKKSAQETTKNKTEEMDIKILDSVKKNDAETTELFDSCKFDFDLMFDWVK